MKTQKVPAVEFKKSIKEIIKNNPKASKTGRLVGKNLKEMGFLTTKELNIGNVKAGNCSKYEVTIGRGVVTYTNLKLKEA